ncbi:mitochondrial glycine transporter B-like [Diadema antillarum]|uniref:mitochondrial glycine transporter B-like n=1 Tax=Diadema antillarum TaxID=105358 RepID=UPI003A85057A
MVDSVYLLRLRDPDIWRQMFTKASCSHSNDGERDDLSLLSSALDNPSVKSFISGTISGTCSCVLLQPLDLLKTRIQAARAIPSAPGFRASSPAKGLISTTFSVVRKEKVTGLWRGLSPSLARTVPGVGLYFLSLHTIQDQFGWQELTAAQGLISGGLARVLVGTVLLPFTVVKTRYESKSYRYKSVAGALRTIHSQEGFKGLYSGLLATLLRDAPFSGLYLAFYSQAKQLTSSVSSQMTAPVHFSCGIVAGVLASAVTQPFDVVKTSMQLKPAQYQSFLPTVRQIVMRSGVRGMFTGMVPRCLRRALMAALTWTVYEEMKVKLNLR